ncbi:MAG: pyridoxamine 5'-phosphate oxidase family protein [Wenzhouxiangella sp.]
MSQDPYPWAQALDSLHDQVWTRLIRGVHDRRAAARHPTLATVSVDGKPQARTVVLRAVDRELGTLDIHTDRRSAKVAELAANPYAALHVWDAKARLQLRLETRVVSPSAEAVDLIWSRVSDTSRLSYGGEPGPGEPLPDALAYRKSPEPARFVVLRLVVERMDILHLGSDHRRARFQRVDGWQGQWLVP